MSISRRLIDLSVPTESSPSEPQSPTVRHLSHQETARTLTQMFGCAQEDLPDGLGWAVDQVDQSSHTGTHVDAPWHYFPTSQGKPAITIEECPLEWFFSAGVVLDFRSKERGALIGVDDLQRELARIAYKLKPLDIVLLWTGADALWGKAAYFEAGCGLGRDSTLWLCDQGVKVIGTDAWGLDRPFWSMKAEFAATRDPSILWAAHRAGIDRVYCQIEKVANLDQLPRPFGFTVSCFPVKLTGGSAGWTRCVAIVDESVT